MEAARFAELTGADFFAGVPDSQLKALCAYLVDKYGEDPHHHIIAANEGNAAALAAGYFLATGKTAVVYMQNSGEGNVINPLASLLNTRVYGIPVLFVIGWRGEPGVHDEPQHIYQGMVTEKLMEDMEVETFVLDKETSEGELEKALTGFKALFAEGKQAAVIVKKGALSFEKKVDYSNSFKMNREEAIGHIAKAAGNDVIVSTTGKISRELFEYRTATDNDHSRDFLTVGSMGHCSSIALAVALQKPDRRVWCIDGDGAMLMHMGALAVEGSIHPDNLIHVIINNNAHETVGGMPTVSGAMDVVACAKACGIASAVSVSDFDDLDDALEKIKASGKSGLIEVKCSIGSRADLGRPTTTAMENRNAFMQFLRQEI